jgi:hypothetical protein
VQLTDEAFAQLVAEEVKNKLSPEQRETLLNSTHWDRWMRALNALAENLQSQIESIEMDAESDANRYTALGREGKKLAREAENAYASKRAKIERFKFHVDKRLDQVMGMIQTGKPIDMNPFESANFYRRAISKHRELMNTYDLEDTAIDRALWAALENKWDFDEVTTV